MARGRIIKWIRQWGGEDRVVWVNVAKLDWAWRWEEGFYLEPGAPSSRYKYDRVGTWLSSFNGKVEMPHVSLCEDGVAFTDGRHRFAWMRDHGVRFLPVTTTRPEAEQMHQRYGTSSRTTLIPAKHLRRAA